MTAVLETPSATATQNADATPADTTAAPVISFESLGVPTKLVEVLTSQGKANAFPIQADTLPDTLDGKDVLGRGKTGSGKTLAFSIPLVAGLAEMEVKRYVGAPPPASSSLRPVNWPPRSRLSSNRWRPPSV